MPTARPIALTRRQLYQRVWSQPLSVVARDLGVSGNALAKICNRLLVPYPPRGYWAKKRGGKPAAQPPLPAAPESELQRITISSVRSGSRRTRTRLDPTVRREQLIEVAEQIVREHGPHAASMKRIAATAGISETQVYNYFGSPEKLMVEMARREFGKIRAAREIDKERAHDHYSRITLTTQTYLREIGQRGDLLQLLLSSPEVRAMLRTEHRKQYTNDVRTHAQGLVDLYGVSMAVALGCTVVLTRLCLNAGKLIADKKISLDSGERLCLSMMLNGSRNIVGAAKNTVGVAESVEAA